MFGTNALKSAGGTDLFVAKIDARGAGPNFSYSIRSESEGNPNSANAIDVDSDGYAYVAGHFTGTALFGSFTVGSTQRGPSHAFVARLDDARPRRGHKNPSRR